MIFSCIKVNFENILTLVFAGLKKFEQALPGNQSYLHEVECALFILSFFLVSNLSCFQELSNRYDAYAGLCQSSAGFLHLLPTDGV